VGGFVGFVRSWQEERGVVINDQETCKIWVAVILQLKRFSVHTPGPPLAARASLRRPP
jgi:hypothetical protein